MKRLPMLTLAVLSQLLFATPQQPSAFPAEEITTSLQFNEHLLNSLGFDLVLDAPTGEPFREGYTAYAATAASTFSIVAPRGIYDGIAEADITHIGGFTLRMGNRDYSLRGFNLVKGTGKDNFLLLDTQGMPWFHVRMAHPHLFPSQQRLRLLNMDLLIHRDFAELIGRPDLELAFAGGIDLTARVIVPEPQESEEGLCTPDFTGVTDVLMGEISSVTQISREVGVRVAIAASAALTNIGTADVAWYRSIAPDGNVAPELIGPHPILVFQFYRIANGRIEMIGRSDAKHAFYSINSGCSCQGDQILYVGCSDLYGAITNATQFYLAPRSEIRAYDVAWSSSNSHFDGTPVDDFRNHGSAGHDSFDHRLIVAETDLQVANAQYFIEGWYMIAGDVNIFNTMGTRQVAPNLGGSAWSFPNVDLNSGAHPAIERWVPFPTTDPMQAHVQYTDPDGFGHLRIAANVTQQSDTTFRYEYAIANYDYHRQVRIFEIPVPDDVQITEIDFLDWDDDMTNDWVLSRANGIIRWEAPLTTVDPLPWSRLLNIGFTANAKPRNRDGRFEPASTFGTPPNDYDINLVTPTNPCITNNDYQNGLADWPQTNILQQLNNLEAICPPLP